MAAREKEGQGKPEGNTMLTRWWVDQGKPRDRAAPPQSRETTVGASFFAAATGYEQEAARASLTDLNLRLLEEGNPPSGGWGYLSMTPDRFPGKILEQIKRAVPLPSGARALAVDSGVSLRVILTGQPTGQRLLELRFSEESSFDAWVNGEWVGEALFQSLPEALRAAPAFIAEHLGVQTDP